MGPNNIAIVFSSIFLRFDHITDLRKILFITDAANRAISLCISEYVDLFQVRVLHCSSYTSSSSSLLLF